MANAKSQGFLSTLFGEEEARGHGRGGRHAASNSRHKTKKHHAGHATTTHTTKSASNGSAHGRSNHAKTSGNKMSRSEAGRKGGLAPHRCRGRGCNE